jgi:hypothetical protein
VLFDLRKYWDSYLLSVEVLLGLDLIVFTLDWEVKLKLLNLLIGYCLALIMRLVITF